MCARRYTTAVSSAGGTSVSKSTSLVNIACSLGRNSEGATFNSGAVM